MRLIILGAVMVVAGCNMAAPVGGSAPAGGGGMREQLVLGSTMSFEQCRARGGLIIQDAGSPMIACDPRVIRRSQVPADEFQHPTTNTG